MSSKFLPKRAVFTRFGLGCSAVALLSGTALAQNYDGSGSPNFVPHTLQDALASAYLTNPTLREERARLRATDERVPTALAGWHPTIQGTANLSYYKGHTSYGPQGLLTGSSSTYDTPGYTGGVTITQPLYQGGKTVASTHAATNQVMAERAHLISVEQQVFMSVVEAYVDVIKDEQLLQLATNNQRVLEQQLHATEERFHIGEITRTDVAQAEAAFASAVAQKQQSEGALQSAQAVYLQVVGIAAAPNLLPPQPLNLPVKSEQSAIQTAAENNPDIISALFLEAQQKDNISVQISAIMPKVSAELMYQHSRNQGYGDSTMDNKAGVIAFQVPIYQGGSEYSAVRGARQQALTAHREVDVQRRAALQKAASGWQQMTSLQEAIKADRVAISANLVALSGVERQALVGTASTLAVLQQQQTLLVAQQSLVQHLSTLVTSSYSVAASIGRLTASDLKIGVPLYDEKAYYNAVKNRLWGISDYARNEPGR